VKKEDSINCTVREVIDTRFTPAHQFTLPSGAVVDFPDKTNYIVLVDSVSRVGNDFVEIHTRGDYDHIAWLEKELQKTKQTLAQLKEMNRNYIKYDMPASKKIMAGRLVRQFGVSELKDFAL
jgi:hypothetical protein